MGEDGGYLLREGTVRLLGAGGDLFLDPHAFTL